MPFNGFESWILFLIYVCELKVLKYCLYHIAYIPPQCEFLALGPHVGLVPQRVALDLQRVALDPQRVALDPQCEPIPTCWYPKSLANPTQTISHLTQSIAHPTRIIAHPTRYQTLTNEIIIVPNRYTWVGFALAM